MGGTSLDQIITDLTDTDKPLPGILLRTKVLLRELERPELAAFITKELDGYGDEDDLPSYRKLTASVHGSVACIAWRMPDTPLLTHYLDDKFRDAWEKANVRDGISKIEDLTREVGGDLRRAIPMEANALLSNGLDDGIFVQQAWSRVGKTEVRNICSAVRSNLLDFMLELKSAVGTARSEEALISKAGAVDVAGIFSGAMFGNNTTIVMGDNNRLSVSNTIVSAEDQLFAKLKAAGVATADLEDLKTAIAEDKGSGGPSLTKATGRWYENLVRKAKSGAVHLGEAVVTHTVAAAIVHYISVAAS